jgi:hypothetical protein
LQRRKRSMDVANEKKAHPRESFSSCFFCFSCLFVVFNLLTPVYAGHPLLFADRETAPGRFFFFFSLVLLSVFASRC